MFIYILIQKYVQTLNWMSFKKDKSHVRFECYFLSLNNGETTNYKVKL